MSTPQYPSRGSSFVTRFARRSRLRLHRRGGATRGTMPATLSGARYGAVEKEDRDGEEEEENKSENVSEKIVGWPSWSVAPWAGARHATTTGSLVGSREGVLFSVWCMEAARAFVVAAVVSTLAAGLFRGEENGNDEPPKSMDPSVPWLDVCHNDGVYVKNENCAHSPTQVVSVQLVFVLGSLIAFPLASKVADANRFGFPAVLFIAATVAPVVVHGYAVVGVTAVTPALLLVRILGGVYKSFNELGQETGVATAFIPGASGTPAAFGSRIAAGCIFGIVAPVAMSQIADTYGTKRVFDWCTLFWVVVWVVVVVFVVVPAIVNRKLPVNGAENREPEEEGEGDDAKDNRTKDTDDTNDDTDDNNSSTVHKKPPGLLTAWYELFSDPTTSLLLFLSMCVGTAEFFLEGPLMMFLAGVASFSNAQNAMYLSVYNIPRGIVSVFAEQVLRIVLGFWLVSFGLVSAGTAVGLLAAIGEGFRFNVDADVFGVHWEDGENVSETSFKNEKHGILCTAFLLGLGVTSVHCAMPVLLMQAASKPRHGSRFGAAFGLSQVAAKLGGGTIGMGLAAIAVERMGFTSALTGIACVLFVGAVMLATRGRHLKVRFD